MLVGASSSTFAMFVEPKIVAGGHSLDIDTDSGQATHGAWAMNRFTRGLVAAAISAIALGGAVGVASAQPVSPPPVPSILDQLAPLTPSIWINPNDEGGPTSGWGGVGMFCENQWVRCQ